MVGGWGVPLGAGCGRMKRKVAGCGKVPYGLFTVSFDMEGAVLAPDYSTHISFCFVFFLQRKFRAVFKK